MRDSKHFANMQLACTVHLGPRESPSLTGTTLCIDSHAVTLKLPPSVHRSLKLSEMMTLEIPLPDSSKCMRVRGWVTRLDPLPKRRTLR
jgi:hypothetical protein